jgi:hypothetical protein
MRRQVAASMLENGFFQNMDFLPNLESTNQPAWIGIPQLDEPAFYYLLVSFPLVLLRSAQISTQLLAARLVSLIFFLITILAAWGIMKEIYSPKSPLRWLIPATLAFFPGLANLMTAVNNDAGAIAVFSLFLWGAVRLIKRGLSWSNFFLAAGTAALGLFTKSTTFIAFPLLILAMLLSLFRGPLRRFVWGILVTILLFFLLTGIAWGDAALWYRSTPQESSTRSIHPKAVSGEYVLRLETGAEVNPRWFRPLFQPIPEGDIRRLAGKTVTLGVWMWASQPVQARTPQLAVGGKFTSKIVSLGEEPDFYAFQATLSENADRGWVSLAPAVKDAPARVNIYYDGLVLAEGIRPVEETPTFESNSGERGVWGGQIFENLLRNTSAEYGTVYTRPWVNSLVKGIFSQYNQPSFLFSYFTDWEGVSWHYRQSALRLFRTFWGQFGWGHVPLLGHKPYRSLAALTFAGITGAGIGLWRRKQILPWRILLLMGLALAGAWGSALLRGVNQLASVWLYLPVARYAYIAIIPTMLVLAIGWWEILVLLARWFTKVQMPSRMLSVVYFGLLLWLDGYSLLSIHYYYR